MKFEDIVRKLDEECPYIAWEMRPHVGNVTISIEVHWGGDPIGNIRFYGNDWELVMY